MSWLWNDFSLLSKSRSNLSIKCSRGIALRNRSFHAVSSYYFDSSSKACRPFSFTGCGGNENNFKTKGECIKFCSAEVICARGEPHPDRYSINQIASCMEDKHCPRNYTCTARNGKKGACCPSKEFVCGTPIEFRGSCRKDNSIWTFDYKSGSCTNVARAPCDEHWNSFANEEQCIDHCVGTCPNDREAHINPKMNQPQLCDLKQNSGCPIGFQCTKTSPFAAICCQASPICPSPESILQLNKDGEPVRCNPERQDCSDQYSCQQAPNLEHICCSRPLDCPTGMKTLREDRGRPRICSPGVPGNCPDDHICVGTTENSMTRHICCKPESKCLLPYVDEKIRPKRCFPGDNLCPETTLCLPALEDNSNVTNSIDLMFFCCHSVDVFTCSDGTVPIIDTTTRRPMRCNRSNPHSCPSDRVCSALIDGSYSCCPHPLLTEICVEAVEKDGAVFRCKSFDDNSCMEGKCRRATNGDYICCRVLSQPQRFFHPGISFVPAVYSNKKMRMPKPKRRPFYLRNLP